MAKVGIFFGTDTGNTRRIAKQIAKHIGDVADKPANIRNAEVEDLLAYEVLILGTPTYGEGELPGLSTGNNDESWEEFLPKLAGSDLVGKTVALYGLGDQQGYPTHFVSAMGTLYDAFTACGAKVIGFTQTEGYDFKHSTAVIGNEFVGLALDEDNQKELSDARLNAWLETIAPAWA